MDEARAVASTVAAGAVEMAVTGRIPRSRRPPAPATLARGLDRGASLDLRLDLDDHAWSDAWTAATDVVASVRQDMQDAMNRLHHVQQALEGEGGH